MKKSILLLFIIISTVAFSQSKKETLTQKWKLDKISEFGQEYAPMDNQKNDWLAFSANGKFKGIIESNHVEGPWSAGSKVVVSVNKKLSKTKINWTKVKVVEKGKFALEYQNGDLITATMLFVPYK
jgi:hypothetical protein